VRGVSRRPRRPRTCHPRLKRAVLYQMS